MTARYNITKVRALRSTLYPGVLFGSVQFKRILSDLVRGMKDTSVLPGPGFNGIIIQLR